MNITGYGNALRQTILHNLQVLREGGSRESFLVPHAVSEPGIGKTRMMRDVVEGLGNEGWELFQDVGATGDSQWVYADADFQTRDSADLAGNPWVMDGRSMRLRPDWLPDAAKGFMTLLALDELAQAPLANLNIAGTLLREGRIGEHVLPRGCMMAAASNPHGSRAGTNAIPGQVKSRVVHYRILPDAEEWAMYAIKRGLSPYLIAYNRRRHDKYHHQYDAAADAYPCGRSWEMFDSVMKLRLSKEDLDEAKAGCVGTAAAMDFDAFMEASLRMPDLNQIIADPLGAPLPVGLDITFVTMQGLASRAKQNNLGAIITYLERLTEPEYGIACVADAVLRDKSLEVCAAYSRWTAGMGNGMALAA